VLLPPTLRTSTLRWGMAERGDERRESGRAALEIPVEYERL